jgi:hypothetical protein
MRAIAELSPSDPDLPDHARELAALLARGLRRLFAAPSPAPQGAPELSGEPRQNPLDVRADTALTVLCGVNGPETPERGPNP